MDVDMSSATLAAPADGEPTANLPQDPPQSSDTPETTYNPTKGPQVRKKGPLAEVRDAGRLGKGLFALQDIPKGTRILSETSIITIPIQPRPLEDSTVKEEVFAFCAELQSTHHSQDKLKALAELADDWNPAQHHEIPHYVHEFYATKTTAQNDAPLLSAIVPHVSKLFKGYVHHKFCPYPEDQHEMGFDTAIFPLYSRINHSCSPNALHDFNSRIMRITVHALRDIKRDEQISIPYINTDKYTKKERGKILNKQTSIEECGCKMCLNGEETDPIQQEIGLHYDSLVRYINPEKYDGDLSRKVPRNAGEALGHAEEMIKLLQHPLIRSEGMTLSQVYVNLNPFPLASMTSHFSFGMWGA